MTSSILDELEASAKEALRRGAIGYTCEPNQIASLIQSHRILREALETAYEDLVNENEQISLYFENACCPTREEMNSSTHACRQVKEALAHAQKLLEELK